MEEAQEVNGNSAAGEEEEPMVGPDPAPRARPKRPLQFEHAYLDSLPSANMYVTLCDNFLLIGGLGFWF